MDQLKEFLRQAIRYRFWIAVGLATLLPIIAYVVGVGPIQTKAATETAAIVSADKDVKQYTAGTVPNDQYKRVVDEKREELNKDVTSAHKKLYARQAPLLTWPPSVEERFKKWGPKWPENVDASTVQEAIIEYVNVYPKFVDEVYATFKPFDPISGDGIVASPGKDLLLRPSQFSLVTPPELGKVWSAQQRLWIQRTLLEVIADVNKGAKSWDSAYIKQINLLEVGSPAAQDQLSLAKAKELEESPTMANPAAPPPAETAAPGGGSPENAAMMAAMMAGRGGMGSGSGQLAPTDSLYFIKTDSTQYRILPVELTVLIEQDHIQDFLVALENSPMAIQPNDFEMAKPATRVSKPKKGENMAFGGYMMGGSSGGMSMENQMMMMQAMMQAQAGGRTTFGGGMDPRMMQYMMGGGRSGGAPLAEKKGQDVRTKDRAKERAEAEKAATAKKATVTLHDPYYNVVEVTIHGEARFYNPPPAEPAPVETTQPPAEATAEAGTPKAEGEAPKKEETPKAEAPAEKKAEEPKKAEAAPAEEPKKAEAEKKAETPKEEPKKAEAGTEKKAEAPKAKDEAKK